MDIGKEVVCDHSRIHFLCTDAVAAEDTCIVDAAEDTCIVDVVQDTVADKAAGEYGVPLFPWQLHYDTPRPLRYCDLKDHSGSSIDIE